MPYIYQITFDISYEERNQLQIGQSLQLSLSYLRAFLPSEPGFIHCRGMYSLTHTHLTHLIWESTWEDWASLENHRNNSPYDEYRLLNEFELKVRPENMATHVYEEI